MPGLVYSFVARGTTVLADYTSYTGNFSTVAIQCLEKCPTDNSKFTYTCDRHTFNYLVEGGYSEFEARQSTSGFEQQQLFTMSLCAAFLAVADEGYGRQIPFAFLDKCKEEFLSKHAEKSRQATAHSLDKSFG